MTTPLHTDPFAAARWDLVAGRTVLVVIDAQNDFLHEDGWYAQRGIDISHMRRTVEPTKELVAAARHVGLGALRRARRPPGRPGRCEEPALRLLQHGPGSRPARARRGDGSDRGRAHEPVRRRDVEGRKLPRLQADRRRGVHRDDASAPARPGARDDAGRLGRGARGRADDRRATRAGGACMKIAAHFLPEDFPVFLESVKTAEEAGYARAWVVDSQMIWEDVWVYMTHALAATERICESTTH